MARLRAALLTALTVALAMPGSALATDTLLGGQTLTAGQSLTSADGRYQLAMQGDGNLVLYADSRPLWSSGTAGDSGDHAVLQGDGNLVLYDSANQALWSSNTSGAGCANLVVQNDGDLVLYKPSGPVWATNTVQSTLEPGDVLQAGQAIFSPHEQYELIMQGDGNLVVYGPAGALWSTATNGIAGNWATMQTDGNLVVYTSLHRALWDSHTDHHPGADVAMQDDGNLVVYGGGKPLWASNTSAHRPAGAPRYQRPAFQACPPPPPPPPPPSPAPSDPVVLIPRTTTVRHLHVRLTISWTWNRSVTEIHRLRITHVPRRATVTVTCRGRGCPRHGVHVGARRLRRLARLLEGRRLHAGARLLVSIAKRGFRPERVAIRIRYGRLPRIQLLR